MLSISLFYCYKKDEYMNDWKKFNETWPGKEDFCSHLNIKDITDADYTHGKRFCKDFEIKI